MLFTIFKDKQVSDIANAKIRIKFVNPSEEKEFWKKEYNKKDEELKEKNQYIQGINTQVFALLGTEEDNKKQAEESKKGFWHKLFK